MDTNERWYLCIDLKSFYASVECVERGLDPMRTRLVVADPSRGDKTICLAVSPALKALGVPNRCRVFQIPTGIDYIQAPPRMQRYIDYSAEIYGIYLKYISKEDIFVYSIDEAFLDVSSYLALYQMDARTLALTILADIRRSLGVVATCGIGTNLYLSKIALDITAKHAADYIGFLDERRYKQTLWSHKPLTDFWRIGPGTARRLAGIGVYTMGELVRTDPTVIRRMFGVDAEILLDHAHGREPSSICDIRHYRKKDHSLCSGQVLMRDYSYAEALLILKEMTYQLCLDLVDAHMITNTLYLHVGFAKDSLPPVQGSLTMPITTNAVQPITAHMCQLFEKLIKPDASVRRMTLSFLHLTDESYEQYDLFTSPEQLEKDRQLQRAVLDIRKKYGKNAVLRCMDLQEAGTAKERNLQIGGHKSGEDA